MENKLIEYFSKITTLSKDEADALTQSMTIKHYKKGSFLVKEGLNNTDTFFILSGLIKQYKVIDGDEISTAFFFENQWIISLTSFSNDTIATANLLCVEDTSVVIGDEKKAQALFKEFPRFETISRAVMEHVFAEQHKRMSQYITDSPEQRYTKLLSSNPDLFQRVPQYDIASYIGVKPESLSRIRKRISSKNH